MMGMFLALWVDIILISVFFVIPMFVIGYALMGYLDKLFDYIDRQGKDK